MLLKLILNIILLPVNLIYFVFAIVLKITIMPNINLWIKV